MTVVADTTPLNYLVLINAIDVLPALFGEVLTPQAVIDELVDARAPSPVRTWAQAPPAWHKVTNPTSRLPSTSALDPGEAHSISLARELGISDILLDERRGRNVAAREGLIALPTLAILERAAEKKLLDLPPMLQALQLTTFRIPQGKLDEALGRDEARKRAAAGGSP